MTFRDWWMTIDWGTAPDWAAAVGTIAAVATALWFGLRDGARLKQEKLESAKDRKDFREREAAAEEERRRREALRLGWELETNGQPYTGLVLTTPWNWTLTNKSEEAFYDVNLLWRLPPSPGRTIYANCPEIAPDSSSQFIDLAGAPDEAVHEIQFTDAHGQRWRRRRYGRLEKIEPGHVLYDDFRVETLDHGQFYEEDPRE